MARMVRLREASKETGLPYNYLRQACNNHEFPHVWSGNRILINVEWLEHYLSTEGLGEKHHEIIL